MKNLSHHRVNQRSWFGGAVRGIPRILAILLGIGLSTSTLFAQDGSPVQPEFVAPPVAPGPAVNQFTGDFTFGLPILTVPGPNGSGHSLTLSYRAGTNPNGEVGWVGYGWSLNPGAIVRNKRGFPDDWDGEVTIHTKQPPDFTISRTRQINAEVASGDLIDTNLMNSIGLGGLVDSGLSNAIGLKAGYSSTLRFDSRSGFADVYSTSGGTSILTSYAGVSHSVDNGEGSFAGVIVPNLFSIAQMAAGTFSMPPAGETPEFTWSNLLAGSIAAYKGILKSPTSVPITFRGSQEFSMSPPAQVPLTGHSSNFGWKFGLSISPGVFVGADYGWGGNFTETRMPKRTQLRALGYMHSAAGIEDPDALMDFYYENDVPYIKDDDFLPIPFANADVFTVIGGGTFRLHNRGIGEFHSNAVTSKLSVGNEEVSVNGGATWGAGLRFGRGSIKYSSGPWKHASSTPEHSWVTDGDEPWFFRYLGERGGTLEYDNTDLPVRARILDDLSSIQFPDDEIRISDSKRMAVLPEYLRLQHEDWERPARAGYIGYSTHAEMMLDQDGTHYHSFTRDAETRSKVFDRGALADQIGEFALYGAGNSRIVYGLPLYARNERSLQLGLDFISLDSADNITSNAIAHRWIDEYDAPRVQGQEQPSPYAAAWLLTQKTAANYIDMTGDGPTDDDLGGWTLFRYKSTGGTGLKAGESTTGWTKWRAPHNGLFYNAGTLSDPKDDIGTFADGFRENYYLEEIETRTHLAVFILDDPYSADRRKDSYPASHEIDDRTYAGDTNATGAVFAQGGVAAVNGARRLNRIDLYLKGMTEADNILLSRTYFEYDYSLRPNMPNSIPVHPDSTTRHGMLTLKKVWTEALDVHNSTIRPYLFGYDYKKSEDYGTSVQTRYPEIAGYADSLSDAEENPSYSRFDIDPWGYHRPSMLTQKSNHRGWIDQTDSTLYDPAAWQLKWVRMPTGGEMHVQYEEDDYAFVQDRRVLGMVRLKESVGVGFGEQASDNQWKSVTFLDLSSVGTDSSSYPQVVAVRENIARLVDSEKKVYFKFLYALKGTSADLEGPAWETEYIDGYTDVEVIAIDTVDAGLSSEHYAIRVELKGKKSDGTSHAFGVPKRVCWDLVRKRKRGKLGPYEGVENSGNTSRMRADLNAKFYDFDPNSYCKDIDYEHSYLRIPLPANKRGGGLRVKRLLSYDPGIEGDSALYGTEYRYEVYDQERREVISSGVAANEPAGMRTENPLIAYMAKEEDEEVVGKVISGRDRARNEGPIGETLLPGASVGYSRVATHPIHQGASTSGFAVSDFYTLRDFPFDARYPGIGASIEYTGVATDEYDTPGILENLIIFRQSETLLYSSQGYRFVQTDIHGRPRRAFTNGGAYSPFEDDWMTSSSLEYDYFMPGDSIPMLYRAGDSIRYGMHPGKSMEVVHAHRRNGSYINDAKVEADGGFIFFSALPYYSISNSELSTHVTSKVVQYPVLLRGVRSYADGNYEYRENVAFDPLTGAPSVVRTRDAFDGLDLDQSPGGHVGTFRSYSFRAQDVHPEFATVASNERALIESKTDFSISKAANGSGRVYLDFPAGSETRELLKLTPGDLIELTETDVDDTDAGRYWVDAIEGTVVWLLESLTNNEPSDPALAVTGEVDVYVVRSGRLNLPGASLGGVATYGTTDADAAVGANFGFSGTGANERLAFVDQLNVALGSDSGTFNSGNVSSGLSFEWDGTCEDIATHGLTFSLSTSGDTLSFAGNTSTADSIINTIVHLGAGGYFDLDDGGQVVFRSHGHLPSLGQERSEPGPTSRISAVRFCGDSTLYRTVENVIAASATLMSDTVDWFGTTVVDVDAYDRGERGRWSSRTGYAYRTDVTTGSRPTTGERIYKDAGVFTDFSLFNWRDPASSDMGHWRGLDSVTSINKHNVPYSSIDRLGRSSVTLFRPLDALFGNKLRVPEMTAWNAEEGTIAFESFETYDFDAYSGVSDSIAHSGVHAFKVGPGGSAAYGVEVTVNDHLLAKGAVARYWVYPDTIGLETTYPLSAGSSNTAPTYIARSGAWVLVEQFVSPDSIAAYLTSGAAFKLSFENTGADTLWIDDIKLHPADASSTAVVYDREILRPVATLDNDNFGLYPVYDAEGKAVRTVVETSRGRRTVADAHAHVPGTVRDWTGEGSPWQTSAAHMGSHTPSGLGVLPSEDKQGEGVDFELVDLRVDGSGARLEVLGLPPDEVLDALRAQGRSLEDLTTEQKRLFAEYERLDVRSAELEAQLKQEGLTAEQKRMIGVELENIAVDRAEKLRMLGL